MTAGTYNFSHLTRAASTSIYTCFVNRKLCRVIEPLDQRLQLVISKGQVRAIDKWRRQQADLPSRSAAIRQLIDAGLSARAKSTPRLPKRMSKPRNTGRAKEHRAL